MLYNLFYPILSNGDGGQSWLEVPYRAAMAFFVALLLGLVCGGKLIEFLRHHQKKDSLFVKMGRNRIF